MAGGLCAAEKMKKWQDEMEKARAVSADVDVTDAGKGEEEDGELDLETTANPFILTAAQETVVKPLRLHLDSDSGPEKFPDKAADNFRIHSWIRIHFRFTFGCPEKRG